MFILWWFCSQKLKTKMKSFYYLLIFISGAICSYIMYATINYLSNSNDRHMIKRTKISYMPEERYLEVRNDFSVQSPSDGTNFIHKDIIEEMAKNEGTYLKNIIYTTLKFLGVFNYFCVLFIHCSKFTRSIGYTKSSR